MTELKKKFEWIIKINKNIQPPNLCCKSCS